MTDTGLIASTTCSFLTIPLRLLILSTPSASITVVTIGSLFEMAAMARETGFSEGGDMVQSGGVAIEHKEQLQSSHHTTDDTVHTIPAMVKQRQDSVKTMTKQCQKNKERKTHLR